MIRELKLQVNKSIDNNMDNSNTNSMKIAISIPDELFEEVKKLATKNKTSRSKIFSIAIKEYLEKIKSQKLLEALNRVYSGEETGDEKRLRRKSLEYYDSSILKDSNDNSTG